MPASRATITATWALFAGLAAPLAAQSPEAVQAEFFEKHIRPVLVQHCYDCHGNGEVSGGLRLDARDLWQRGGDSGPAIVPGQPAESRLLRALRYDDTDLQMPPEGKLSDAIVADFERWIADGAFDPRVEGSAPASALPELDLESARQHWAYRLPQRSALPTVHDNSWPADPLDRFILARLEAAELPPAPDADRATLVRRLSFDLLGLPPSPAEIEAFLADDHPAAYERLVDRWLASPQFGERWGRHWLDVVRFGESFTLRGLVMHEAWRYRDWVIESFNADRPFDETIRAQVAGDLLPAADVLQAQQQRIATTFLALGNNNLEEQDKAQLRMDVVDEQLDTIGRAFLAQTIGCARCHDHKFDPIPTADYYALAGILRSVQTLEDANVSQWLDVPLPLPAEEEARFAAHEARESELTAAIAQQKSLLASLEKQNPAQARVIAAADLPGVVVDDVQATTVGTWLKSKSVPRYVGDGYVHDANQGQGAKSITFQPELPSAGRYEVRLSYTPSDNRATNTAITVFSADGEFEVRLDQRQPPTIDGRFASLGRYRFEPNGQGFVMVTNTGADGHVVADAVQFLTIDLADAQSGTEGDAARPPELAAAGQRLKQLEGELRQLRQAAPRRPRALSIVERGTGEDTTIHVRGSVHNQREIVPRGVLRVADYDLPRAMPTAASGRFELAAWLASDRNPLTARVLVNRVWHWLLGSGLVRTCDNFGTTGGGPSHPELLDELAVEFMADGWSIKRLVRRIVLSRTYRLASAGEGALVQADPENRLFGRVDRRRLEAECLRDAMLSAAGRLDLTSGGPTVPANISSDYGFVDAGTRRSVYVPVLRNALPELFRVFDFADPSLPTGVRNVSTVAPQALFLMNDPFVREQAEHAARRLLALDLDEPARIDHAYLLLVGRRSLPAEAQAVEQFLAGDLPRDEAWTQVVHALFSSIDFRYLH